MTNAAVDKPNAAGLSGHFGGFAHVATRANPPNHRAPGDRSRPRASRHPRTLDRVTSGALDTRTRPSWVRAGVWSAGFVAVLWVSEIVDTLLGNRLDAEGIRPGDPDGLTGIAWAPLLHGGFGHLLANTVPLLVLGFLVAALGRRPAGRR